MVSFVVAFDAGYFVVNIQLSLAKLASVWQSIM
jgi:hypothetical protein